ncbi:MAG: His/Gly/Thr/Pro-type tRNA ligase C-terminal domain-containing protein, partial [Patescibacteria group bacterium]
EIVLRLPKELAPVKVAVLPLSKKPELSTVARELAQSLRKNFVVQYDESQSIGKRYRRQDEIGTPYCVTVDFDSLEDKKVTVRDRDTMGQERIAITDLTEYLRDNLSPITSHL